MRLGEHRGKDAYAKAVLNKNEDRRQHRVAVQSGRVDPQSAQKSASIFSGYHTRRIQ